MSSEIKSKVQPEKLEDEEIREVNKNLERIESQNLANLHSIFSSLEILLCNIRYTTENIDNQETISEYTSRIKGNDKISEFLRNERLSEIKLKNILNFYQILEERLFKYIIEFISPEYNLPLEEVIRQKIINFLGEANILNLLKNVVQRFIIRCLVSNLEAKFPIKE